MASLTLETQERLFVELKRVSEWTVEEVVRWVSIWTSNDFVKGTLSRARVNGSTLLSIDESSAKCMGFETDIHFLIERIDLLKKVDKSVHGNGADETWQSKKSKYKKAVTSAAPITPRRVHLRSQTLESVVPTIAFSVSTPMDGDEMSGCELTPVAESMPKKSSSPKKKKSKTARLKMFAKGFKFKKRRKKKKSPVPKARTVKKPKRTWLKPRAPRSSPSSPELKATHKPMIRSKSVMEGILTKATRKKVTGPMRIKRRTASKKEAITQSVSLKSKPKARSPRSDTTAMAFSLSLPKTRPKVATSKSLTKARRSHGGGKRRRKTPRGRVRKVKSTRHVKHVRFASPRHLAPSEVLSMDSMEWDTSEEDSDSDDSQHNDDSGGALFTTLDLMGDDDMFESPVKAARRRRIGGEREHGERERCLRAPPKRRRDGKKKGDAPAVSPRQCDCGSQHHKHKVRSRHRRGRPHAHGRHRHRRHKHKGHSRVKCKSDGCHALKKRAKSLVIERQRIVSSKTPRAKAAAKRKSAKIVSREKSRKHMSSKSVRIRTRTRHQYSSLRDSSKAKKSSKKRPRPKKKKSYSGEYASEASSSMSAIPLKMRSLSMRNILARKRAALIAPKRRRKAVDDDVVADMDVIGSSQRVLEDGTLCISPPIAILNSLIPTLWTPMTTSQRSQSTVSLINELKLRRAEARARKRRQMQLKKRGEDTEDEEKHSSHSRRPASTKSPTEFVFDAFGLLEEDITRMNASFDLGGLIGAMGPIGSPTVEEEIRSAIVSHGAAIAEADSLSTLSSDSGDDDSDPPGGSLSAPDVFRLFEGSGYDEDEFDGNSSDEKQDDDEWQAQEVDPYVDYSPMGGYLPLVGASGFGAQRRHSDSSIHSLEAYSIGYNEDVTDSGLLAVSASVPSPMASAEVLKRLRELTPEADLSLAAIRDEDTFEFDSHSIHSIEAGTGVVVTRSRTSSLQSARRSVVSSLSSVPSSPRSFGHSLLLDVLRPFCGGIDSIADCIADYKRRMENIFELPVFLRVKDGGNRFLRRLNAFLERSLTSRLFEAYHRRVLSESEAADGRHKKKVKKKKRPIGAAEAKRLRRERKEAAIAKKETEMTTMATIKRSSDTGPIILLGRMPQLCAHSVSVDYMTTKEKMATTRKTAAAKASQRRHSSAEEIEGVKKRQKRKVESKRGRSISAGDELVVDLTPPKPMSDMSAPKKTDTPIPVLQSFSSPTPIMDGTVFFDGVLAEADESETEKEDEEKADTVLNLMLPALSEDSSSVSMPKPTPLSAPLSMVCGSHVGISKSRSDPLLQPSAVSPSLSSSPMSGLPTGARSSIDDSTSVLSSGSSDTGSSLLRDMLESAALFDDICVTYAGDWDAAVLFTGDSLSATDSQRLSYSLVQNSKMHVKSTLILKTPERWRFLFEMVPDRSGKTLKESRFEDQNFRESS